jgi:predicted MFS family arabinose efflux permease
VSFSIAAVLGVPAGLWLAEAFGWRWTFIAIGIASVPVLLAAARLLPAMRSHIDRSRPLPGLVRLRQVFGEPNHLRAFAFVTLLMFAGFTVIPFIAPYLVTSVGVTEGELPLVYLSGGLATLVSTQVIGRLADRFGKKRVFSIVAALSIGPILLVTHLAPVRLGAALAACTAFFVLVTGRFGPAMALISGSVEPRLRGSFMSFNASIQQMGAGLASLTAGLLVVREADGALRGFDRVGWVAVAATVACIWLVGRIRVVHDGSVDPARE